MRFLDDNIVRLVIKIGTVYWHCDCNINAGTSEIH